MSAPGMASMPEKQGGTAGCLSSLVGGGDLF